MGFIKRKDPTCRHCGAPADYVVTYGDQLMADVCARHTQQRELNQATLVAARCWWQAWCLMWAAIGWAEACDAQWLAMPLSAEESQAVANAISDPSRLEEW